MMNILKRQLRLDIRYRFGSYLALKDPPSTSSSTIPSTSRSSISKGRRRIFCLLCTHLLIGFYCFTTQSVWEGKDPKVRREMEKNHLHILLFLVFLIFFLFILNIHELESSISTRNYFPIETKLRQHRYHDCNRPLHLSTFSKRN